MEFFEVLVKSRYKVFENMWIGGMEPHVTFIKTKLSSEDSDQWEHFGQGVGL